jgi:transposase-like protein
MARSAFSEDRFQNEDAAFAYVEAILWPTGPTCPHCGNADPARIAKMEGKTTRRGLYNCRECRKPFTVRMGTIFESSHLPLHLWLQAMHLMCASKKGVSTNQLQRMLACSMKTAWFLSHRIRAAMAGESFEPMGGAGEIVEIDETYIGRKVGVEVRRGAAHKNAVLTLVERGGSARSFHLDGVKKSDAMPIIEANLDPASHVMTDESYMYGDLAKSVESHKVVDHGREEWAYTDRQTGERVHTNTVEGYYSVFKRGMIGIYQHCSEQHLHRYLAEFDFRHSNRKARGVNDTERADRALKGVKGKRLTYETTKAV